MLIISRIWLESLPAKFQPSIVKNRTMFSLLVLATFFPALLRGELLDKQKLLEAQTFWDNRDWDWYKKNIPFFECPDPDITTTYYYRWELVTKHLTYGSPQSGYSFTEFIDRPFWSGAYGSISCPAGHQLYEVRWLRDQVYARDYARYWFRTPGAEPRKYSTWLADAVWAVHEVHWDEAFVKDLLPDLLKNFEGWEQRHWVPEAGMFWQIGHDDGMEYNINSRQTQDIVRGAPGFRPSFNAYMWADEIAIARIAEVAGDPKTAATFRAKASALKQTMQKALWDPKRNFFFQMYKKDERDRQGNEIKAGTLTYQSGKFEGSEHGREEIGFVPWQFNMPDPGYESAWKFLMDPNYFFADFGPATVERQDPMYYLSPTCCWWSGMSWPYATTQTLKGMANLLHNYKQSFVTRGDYFKLLQIYARTHRKKGQPYIAEACHPDTGSWEGHDSYNHSEHYFHSGYNDLIITGLCGLSSRGDKMIEIAPLAPESWEYFALEDVPYRGHLISVLWDKKGERYGKGPGLHLFIDGREMANINQMGKIIAPLLPRIEKLPAPRMNFAVNNDGYHFPQITATFTGTNSNVAALNDGNYWYDQRPPNRWTTVDSTNVNEFVDIDLGIVRRVDTIKLYFLEDGTNVLKPRWWQAIYATNGSWNYAGKTRTEPRGDWEVFQHSEWEPKPLEAHHPTVVTFDPVTARQFHFVFCNQPGSGVGLTEIEIWGDAVSPYAPPQPPPGNIALNMSGEGFPKASASFTDRFGGNPMAAIDGKIIFKPSPMNRWTSYGSTHDTDWIEVDFGVPRKVGRADLYIYDDRGGVKAPASYEIQAWMNNVWQPARTISTEPPQPAGATLNRVRFKPVTTEKIRVVFTPNGNASSGLTELELFEN